MITIKTKRPILSEPTSNCCGMSNADGDKGSLKDLIAMGKDYLSDQKADRQESRGDAVTSILADRTTTKNTKRDNRAIKRSARQESRSKRKEARFQRRMDRKAKRNSKRLVLINTQGGEKYFFPLQRIRLGKKKYKDGSEGVVAPKDQVTVTTPKGETAIVDKNEVAKAMGVDPSTVTQSDVQKAVTIIPQPIVTQQGVSEQVVQQPNEPVIAINVPETNLQTAGDGELYLEKDLQDTKEVTKDVKDEEKGLSKTQKIVLWSGVGVATLIVGYLIYKAVKK